MDRSNLLERSAGPETARNEWRANLPLVLASMVGLSLCTVPIYALGQFMEPLQSEFGWSRTQVMAGASVQSLATFVMSAPMGRLIDKRNGRHIAIAGILLCALSIASFSLLNGSFGTWLTLWSIFAVVGIMTSPILWVAAVSAAFERGRSLAVALTLAGLGLGSTFAPPVARYLIDAFGWRHAFQLLALGWGGLALILTLAFFFDRRSVSEPAVDRQSDARPMRAVLGTILTARFITLGAAVFGSMLVISGLMLNISPVLVHGGYGRADAAYLAGIAGFATIAGKLLAGSLFDHVPSSVVTTASMTSLGLSCFLLQHVGWSGLSAAGACFLLGAAAGSMSTIMACMTGRMFAPEDFGTIYGLLISIMSFGGIVGPFVAGLVFDLTGSYQLLLWSGIAVAILSAGLMNRLRTASQSGPEL